MTECNQSRFGFEACGETGSGGEFRRRDDQFRRLRIRRRVAGIERGAWWRKAEHIDGKENPRFVVTSLTSQEWEAQPLYEELYCARGDMENRIKEQFSLFADRVSTETMRANQLRLYLLAMTYALMSGLRRLGLKATELAAAQVSTIRTKLLKDPAPRSGSLCARSGCRWRPATRGRISTGRCGRT